MKQILIRRGVNYHHFYGDNSSYDDLGELDEDNCPFIVEDEIPQFKPQKYRSDDGELYAIINCSQIWIHRKSNDQLFRIVEPERFSYWEYKLMRFNQKYLCVPSKCKSTLLYHNFDSDATKVFNEPGYYLKSFQFSQNELSIVVGNERKLLLLKIDTELKVSYVKEIDFDTSINSIGTLFFNGGHKLGFFAEGGSGVQLISNQTLKIICQYSIPSITEDYTDYLKDNRVNYEAEWFTWQYFYVFSYFNTYDYYTILIDLRTGKIIRKAEQLNKFDHFQCATRRKYLYKQFLMTNISKSRNKTMLEMYDLTKGRHVSTIYDLHGKGFYPFEMTAEYLLFDNREVGWRVKDEYLQII